MNSTPSARDVRNSKMCLAKAKEMPIVITTAMTDLIKRWRSSSRCPLRVSFSSLSRLVPVTSPVRQTCSPESCLQRLFLFLAFPPLGLCHLFWCGIRSSAYLFFHIRYFHRHFFEVLAQLRSRLLELTNTLTYSTSNLRQPSRANYYQEHNKNQD